MAFLHLFVSLATLAAASSTVYQYKPIQTPEYNWEVLSFQEPIAAPSTNAQGSVFNKFSKKKAKFQKLSSWFTKRNEASDQKVEVSQPGQYPILKLHKYKGVELRPIAYVDLHNMAPSIYPPTNVHINSYANRPVKNTYHTEEPKENSAWDISNGGDWTWNVPEMSEWASSIPQKTESPVFTPSANKDNSGIKGSNILPLLSKKGKKLKKINKFKSITSSWRKQSATKTPIYQSIPLTQETPFFRKTSKIHDISDIEDIHIPVIEEVVIPDIPSFQFSIPIHKKKNIVEDSQSHFSENYHSYRPKKYNSKTVDSYGIPVAEYGSESNQVEIIVPPPSGIHAVHSSSQEKTSVSDLNTTQTHKSIRKESPKEDDHYEDDIADDV